MHCANRCRCMQYAIVNMTTREANTFIERTINLNLLMGDNTLRSFFIDNISDDEYLYRIITRVNIPEGIIKLGSGAFECCLNLKTVTLPDSLSTIGPTAFADCTSLKSIEIPDSVTQIGAGAFGYSGLRTVKLGAGLKKLDRNTFIYCKDLTTILFSPSLIEIGSHAFYGCDKLKEVVLPENLQVIGDGAFAECNNLTKVTIPKSTKYVSNEAFNFSNSLKEIIVKNRDLKIAVPYDILNKVKVIYQG